MDKKQVTHKKTRSKHSYNAVKIINNDDY